MNEQYSELSWKYLEGDVMGLSSVVYPDTHGGVPAVLSSCRTVVAGVIKSEDPYEV